MSICKYCGGEAKYQFKNGAWCCSETIYKCPGYKKLLSDAAKKNWDDLKSKGYHVKADIPIVERKDKQIEYDPTVCAWCGRPAIKVLKNGKGCCSEFMAQCPAVRELNSTANLKRTHLSGYKNPNAGHNSSHPAWNKGKTKETDERLMKSSITRKARFKSRRIS